jgi:hypothetical protein
MLTSARSSLASFLLGAECFILEPRRRQGRKVETLRFNVKLGLPKALTLIRGMRRTIFVPRFEPEAGS